MSRILRESYRALGPALLGVLALTGFGIAHAQVPRSGGGASTQLLEQLQQLGSERTELQEQNAKLQKELDGLRKERDALKTAQQALERRAQLSESAVKQLQENVTARRQATDQEIGQWRQRMDELVAKFRDTAKTLQEVETDRTASQQKLAASERDLNTCSERNLALYKLNEEVLTRLAHQSLWTSLASAEPFTRIKRTQLENLIVEDRARADAQRVSTGAPAATASAPATGSK